MLELSDLIGHWLAIFLTLAIFSFLYKDNPIYKIAEHLFIGVSIGFVIVQQIYDTVIPLFKDLAQSGGASFLWLFPAAILTVLLFAKLFSPRIAWLGRYPLAFLIAVYAGLEVGALADSDLGKQVEFTARTLEYETWHKVDLNTDDAAKLGKAGFPPSVIGRIIEAQKAGQRLTGVDDVLSLPGITQSERDLIEPQRSILLGLDGLDDRVAAQRGEIRWFGLISQLLLLIGTICALLYFFFSVPHKGAIGALSRVGIIFLMVAFGAAFGFTVQGRVALAFGRVSDLTGGTMPAETKGQVHPEIVTLLFLVAIVAFLVVWEVMRRRKDERPPGGGAGGDNASHSSSESAQ